jgi:hypothetical protein
MAAEFLRADVHGLFRLLVMVDMFWKAPHPNLAKEIRLEQQAFGLTPIDRRRLEWRVAQAEEAKDKHDRKRSSNAIVVVDPRILEGD